MRAQLPSQADSEGSSLITRLKHDMYSMDHVLRESAIGLHSGNFGPHTPTRALSARFADEYWDRLDIEQAEHDRPVTAVFDPPRRGRMR